MHTQRREQNGNGGKSWNDTVSGQEMLAVTRSQSSSLLEPLKGVWAYLHLDFELPTYRTEN